MVRPKRTGMKVLTTAIVVVICLSLTSCSSPKYLLTLKMEPATTPGANYENDSIKIHFNVTETFIGVKFENKLYKGIKINWDEISFSLNDHLMPGSSITLPV